MFLRLLRAAVPCFAAIATPCQAAESYDNCTGFIDTVPATISTQGTWCLRRDLSTAITSGNAITVATNNVTIDCNDFKVGGLAAGTGTDAHGIHVDGRLNSTIRNCNLRGFASGIVATADGGGHLIEHTASTAIPTLPSLSPAPVRRSAITWCSTLAVRQQTSVPPMASMP